MREMQLGLLQKQLRWAEEKSFFYQQSFAKAGVKAEEVKSLEDLRRFPFLHTSDLHQIDSLDILTLPISGIMRFNHMQQMTGELLKLYTNGDIARNVEMMTRCLVGAGINNTSVVALQGDLSDSRLLDVQYALEMIGATVVPMGVDYRQWLRLMELGKPLFPQINAFRILRAFAGTRPLYTPGSAEGRSVSRGFHIADHAAEGLEGLVAIGYGAGVAPDDGGPQDVLVLVHAHQAVHLVGNADGLDVRRREDFRLEGGLRAHLLQDVGGGEPEVAPPHGGILLGKAGLFGHDGRFALGIEGGGDAFAGLDVHETGLDGRTSDVIT